MTKLVISSTGEAAKWSGGYLGQYECAGEHHGAPYYRQTGDDDNYPHYLYRDAQTAWRAGVELGSTEDGDCGLYHPPTTGDTPPQSGGTRRGEIGEMQSSPSPHQSSNWSKENFGNKGKTIEKIC